jgi:hypothetical protein
MDKLDQEIAEKRASIETLRDKLRIEEIELVTLERAASLRPLPRSPSHSPLGAPSWVAYAPPSSKSPKGRQPGAISHEWRRILGLIVQRLGGSATAEQIADLGEEAGLNTLNASLVRQRMTLYLSHGYVRQEADGKYYVTDAAIGRFELSRSSRSPTAAEAIAAALSDKNDE